MVTIVWILLIIVALPIAALLCYILWKAFIEWNRARKNRITAEDIAFLQAVIETLPSQYAFLKKQAARPDLWLSKSLTYGSGENRYNLTVKIDPSDDFRDRTMPFYFMLKNIRVNNRTSSKTEYVELAIHEGLLCEYQTTAPVKLLDIATIDSSALQEQILHEKRPENADKKKLLQIFKGAKKELLSQLELDDTFEIEIAEGCFYPIKHYDDGNYLAADGKGAIFLLMHDPWAVKKLFDTKEKFFTALESGDFALD